MRFQIDRTRGLYHDARPGYRLLSRDGQLAVAAAADFYEGILEQIDVNDYDVFRHRAHLRPGRRCPASPPCGGNGVANEHGSSGCADLIMTSGGGR